jgi:uncharacterized protein
MTPNIDRVIPEPNVERLRRAHNMLKSDPVFALQELKALADMKSISAMIHLGRAYENGTSVETDMVEAERWYRHAADNGLLLAYYYLGRLYLNLARYNDAISAFSYAAAKEYPPALHFLGRVYFFGLGVTQDLSRSEDYMKRASRRGNIIARSFLATIFMRDFSRPKRVLRGVALRLICMVEFFYILITEGRHSQRFL